MIKAADSSLVGTVASEQTFLINLCWELSAWTLRSSPNDQIGQCERTIREIRILTVKELIVHQLELKRLFKTV